MRTEDLTSTASSRPAGLGRQRREAAGLHGTARRRAAVLCALLGLALALAGWPEFFWGLLKNGQPGVVVQVPTLSADLLLRTAQAAHSQGRLEESARLYGLLLTQHPEHPLAENALAVRVQTLIALGHVEAAQNSLLELRVRSPRSDALSEALLEMACEQMRRGELEQALIAYTDVVAFSTQAEVARPRQEKGPATFRLRRAQYNEKTRIIAHRTRMERIARFDLAVCHDLAGNHAEALRAYERFVRRFPTDARAPEAWFRMGVVARTLGRLDDAVQDFTHVWEAEEAAGTYRAASIYQSGLCLEALQRGDEARTTYARAKALEPRSDSCRLAALHRLALLIRDDEPLQALEIYRDLAEHSGHAVERALAQQNFVDLQNESAVAAAH